MSSPWIGEVRLHRVSNRLIVISGFARLESDDETWLYAVEPYLSSVFEDWEYSYCWLDEDALGPPLTEMEILAHMARG